MKTIIFILCACAVLFVACCNEKDNYSYIPDSAKFKYNVGDILVYKSDSGALDTFKLTRVFQDFIFIKYTGPCSNKGDHKEELTYVFNKGNIGITYPGVIGGATYNNSRTEYSNSYQAFTISGKKYDIVYCFKDDYAKTPKSIVKMYAVPGNGIIWYQQKDSTIWELEQNKNL